MRVYLFVTCLVDTFFPGVGEGMVRVLDRLGVDVEFPAAQTCCGQPAFNSGYRKDAKEVAERFISIFGNALEDRRDEETYIVCPSGSCTTMLKVFYKELLSNSLSQLDKLATITNKTYEFSEFLVNVMKTADVGASYEGVVTYHDSCHLLRELGVKDEPRRLIEAVRGIEFREMEMHDACCGFGGTFSIKFPRVSVSMLDEKIDCIISSGADTVVSSDMGCLMNIGGALSRRKIPVRVMHIAELLAHTGSEGDRVRRWHTKG
jgi:L-lactate dehydrogenase complex protein LldE